MTSTWSLTLRNGTVLWQGSSASAPSLGQLSALLKDLPDDESLSYLATQVVRFAPTKIIGTLLNILCCHYWRNSSADIEIGMLLSLPSASPKMVCGQVFKKGDLVWTCRSCAKDPTCVQCDKCFRDADHSGHEVYFYKSAGSGGCCDCGDPEAWAEVGNCKCHTKKSSTEGSSEIDPTIVVPPQLRRGVTAVMRGVLGIAVSTITCNVRAFQPWDRNDFVSGPLSLAARLHNDDCHSFDDVIGALRAAGIDDARARERTVAVDAHGEAVILSSQPSPALEAMSLIMARAGLLFSLAPDAVVQLEAKVVASLAWMHSLGSANDGLQRIISESLMSEVGALPAYAAAIPDESLARGSRFCEGPGDVFNRSEQFPSLVQHLSTHSTRFSRPFATCPRVIFALLMVASPYGSKAFKKAVNNIIIVFQQDSFFKITFSQLLTSLYPFLSLL